MRKRITREFVAASNLKDSKGPMTRREIKKVKVKVSKWERFNALLEAHQKGINNPQMAAAKC